MGAIKQKIQLQKHAQGEGPDILQYHDYREYLLAWVEDRKLKDPKFSLRSFSKACGFSPSYFSLVLSGQRHLAAKSTDALVDAMKITPSEKSYFGWLRMLAESESQKQRMQALSQILKYRNYQNLNPREFEIFKFLTKWHYVAIRELAGTAGFQLNPKWIQKRLKKHVPVGQIEKALDFLFENEFLQKDESGKVIYPDKKLECTGGVFQIALSQFHQQMMEIAKDSIDTVEKDERSLTGYTFSIPKENFDEVKSILAKAEAQIADLERKHATKGDTVYHVEFAAFPLTEAE